MSLVCVCCFVFFFKQKTAYEMRISDWSSDVCSSDLISLPPGQFGGAYIDQLFTNTLDATAHPYFAQIHTLRVSSHLLIDRRGRLTQYVPLHARAWHAGVSSFEGRERCNAFSIGFELEGCAYRPFPQNKHRRLK